MVRGFVLLFAVVVCAGCGGSSSGPTSLLELGDPIRGLSQAELDQFNRGKEVFERRFARSEGHGPDFNTSSCASCHEIPVTGGSAPLYRNFAIVGRTVNNLFTPILEDDQLVARNFSYTRPMREAIPLTANIVAQRNTPPMFGVGQFERIPTSDILANADPLDSDGDGISGRVNIDGALAGRFGFKAQESGLEDFVRGPIFNHMGITTNPLPVSPQIAGLRVQAQVSAPGEPTTDNDGVADPELSTADLLALVVYCMHLAPPEPLPMDATAERGEAVFAQVGCAKCHIPSLVTQGRPLLAYTDLLIHDMGPDLADGVELGLATGSEFRTQPLWGLRHHAPYLHDGRADTIDDAIRMHGGEAEQIKNEYEALPVDDRTALLRFLETR